MSALNPFLLAAVTPDPDPRLLPLLRSEPKLAADQDAHGYSLLHAAASYNHVELLRTLVNDFNVDVNLRDEDGETCLFVAETIDVTLCLVEELHVDVDARNEEGMNALEKFELEQEFPDVVQYLQAHRAQRSDATESSNTPRLPPLPPNVKINIGSSTAETMGDAGQEPDPEFRKRIEQLAAKEDFQAADSQAELRELITDAIRGVSQDERDVRRRHD